IAVGRQHVGAETISTTFDRRQKLSHRLATDVVSCDQVIFERDGVELSRDRVAFGLRSGKRKTRRSPAQQLRSFSFTNRRALELSPPRIHHPHPRLSRKSRCEVKSVV